MRSPPPMQRTLADDVKVVVFVLAGVMLGYLLAGGDDASLLLGSLIGVVAMTVVFNVLRRVKRR